MLSTGSWFAWYWSTCWPTTLVDMQESPLCGGRRADDHPKFPSSTASLDEANDSNPNGVMSRRGVLVAGGVLGAQWMRSAPKSHHVAMDLNSYIARRPKL